MSDLLKKFGIFDIMGIWAPGSISLVYILFTLVFTYSIDIISVLQDFQSDFSLVLIFFFSIFAYFLGVVYHEIGKAITDSQKPFKLKYLSKRRNKLYSKFFVKCFIDLKNAENYFPKNSNEDIYDVLESIKAKDISISSIEKSRSIYGFSRSIMISFSIHIILLFFCKSKLGVNYITFLSVDSIFFILFLFRTIRYNYIWIQKTFNCYVAIKKEEKLNEPNKTSKTNI